jgi:hypothetical protein
MHLRRSREELVSALFSGFAGLTEGGDGSTSLTTGALEPTKQD